MSTPDSLNITWTDHDGSQATLTTDQETCGDEDAVAVLSIPVVVEGGIYLTPQNARDVIAFLEHALTTCVPTIRAVG